MSPTLRCCRAAWLHLITVSGLVALSSACGHHTPTAPPPPPVLSMQCPADTQVMSPDGQPAVVNYTPTVTSGTPPYTTSCTPSSGAAVAPGTYPVTCTVSDATMQTASCTFSLRVFVPAKVRYTKYLGFGDSLTEGKTSLGPYVLVDFAPDSYTYKLQKLLADRYAGQTISVVNDGLGAELAGGPSSTSPGGVYRLPGSLDSHQPEVLLLMEGTNDLAYGMSGVQSAAYAVDVMVRATRARGIEVLLATIPPQKPGTRSGPESISLIPQLNNEIRAVAVKDDVPLVDVYAALVDHPELIGADGLHLTSAGYDVVATTFFDVIKAKFETRAPSAR